ncbi:hypothetical protein NQ317_015893 [Molorchus minor]|uniref:Uncharacterized protein n=1 Tax=Molorchus minor TaxID=1323400 RepID=A0ABQ9JCE0_9CUCU|nr:hypothetical protein NQ317_015893 [Molorchus minor]
MQHKSNTRNIFGCENLSKTRRVALKLGKSKSKILRIDNAPAHFGRQMKDWMNENTLEIYFVRKVPFIFDSPSPPKKFCSADLPTDLPDLDDFEAIKERCDRKGGAGTFDKVKTAQEKTVTCIGDIINVDTVKSELEEAKKTGSMDEVFGKYCKKRPQIRECIKKTYDAIQPCLEESEKKALNFTADMVTKIGEFACFRDGDRLAMFIAEGGLECLSSRVDGIKNCINETLKFNPATFSPNSIPDLTVDKKKCDDLSTIQQCVVKDLEDNCKRTTPRKYCRCSLSIHQEKCLQGCQKKKKH